MVRKNDIWIVLVFIIIAGSIALAFHFSAGAGDEARIAIISMDGEVIRKINLDTITEPVKIEIEGRYSQIIYAEHGRICFGVSNCPHKSCVKIGWISKQGSTAVCLPNRVIIKIEGNSDETDGVVY